MFSLSLSLLKNKIQKFILLPLPLPLPSLTRTKRVYVFALPEVDKILRNILQLRINYIRSNDNDNDYYTLTIDYRNGKDDEPRYGHVWYATGLTYNSIQKGRRFPYIFSKDYVRSCYHYVK